MCQHSVQFYDPITSKMAGAATAKAAKKKRDLYVLPSNKYQFDHFAVKTIDPIGDVPKILSVNSVADFVQP